MFKLSAAIGLGVALALALPQMASANFRAVNGAHVVPLNDYEIETIGRPGSRKDDYWCAIGDYLRRSKTPWNTRIYVLSGIGQSRISDSTIAVSFTLNPDASGIEIYTNNVITDVLTVGYGRSVSTAWGECSRRLPQFF